ncbi:MAG TPA: sulfite exporter TauE/SafE family protein [Edaphocola sp.]|nr:sulfite exporter TauE/SafE family protein [Edaphocola sp.]
MAYEYFALITFLGALAAGIFGSLTGMGGGAVIIPLLTLGLGVDLHLAIGASLVTIIATSSGSAAAYVKEGMSNVRIGMFLEMATTVGAIAGAFLSAMLPAGIIAIVFGVILIFSSLLSIRKKMNHIIPQKAGTWGQRLKMDSTYKEQDGSVKAYGVKNVFGGFAMMSVAGLMSGLLGIGSGSLKVLAMDNIMRIPFKVSTTTSNFMIGVTAAASAVVYFQHGYIKADIAAPVMVGVLLGAMLGSKILMKAKSEWLRWFFAVVVCYLAAQMIYEGLKGTL